MNTEAARVQAVKRSLAKLAVLTIESIAGALSLALLSAFFTPFNLMSTLLLGLTLCAGSMSLVSFTKGRPFRATVRWGAVAVGLSMLSGVLPFVSPNASWYVVDGATGFAAEQRYSHEFGLGVTVIRDPIRAALAPALCWMGGAVYIPTVTTNGVAFLELSIEDVLRDPIIREDDDNYPGSIVFLPDPMTSGIGRQASLLGSRQVLHMHIKDGQQDEFESLAIAKVEREMAMRPQLSPGVQTVRQRTRAVQFPGMQLDFTYSQLGSGQLGSADLTGLVSSGLRGSPGKVLLAYVDNLGKGGAPSWNWVRIGGRGEADTAIYVATLHRALDNVSRGMREAGLSMIDKATAITPSMLEQARLNCLLARASYNYVGGNFGSLQVAYYAWRAAECLAASDSGDSHSYLRDWCRSQLAEWRRMTLDPRVERPREVNRERLKASLAAFKLMTAADPQESLRRYVDTMVALDAKTPRTKRQAISNQISQDALGKISSAAADVRDPLSAWAFYTALGSRASRGYASGNVSDAEGCRVIMSELLAVMPRSRPRCRLLIDGLESLLDAVAGHSQGRPALRGLPPNYGPSAMPGALEKLRDLAKHTPARWSNSAPDYCASVCAAVGSVLTWRQKASEPEKSLVTVEVIQILESITNRGYKTHLGVWLALASVADAANAVDSLARATDFVRDCTQVPWPTAAYILHFADGG